LENVDEAKRNDKQSTQAIENAKEYLNAKKIKKDIDTVAELKSDLQSEKLNYQRQMFGNKSLRFFKPDRFAINNLLLSCLKETPFTKYSGFNTGKLENSTLKPTARTNLKLKSHKDIYLMCAFGSNMLINAFQVSQTMQIQMHDTDANHIATKSFEGKIIDICANFQFIFVLCQTNLNGQFMVRKFDRNLNFIFHMLVDEDACAISCTDAEIAVVFNSVDDDLPLSRLQKGKIEYLTRVELYDCEFMAKFKSIDATCKLTCVDDNSNIINFGPRVKIFCCGDCIFAVWRSEILTKIECISMNEAMVVGEFTIEQPVEHVEFDGVGNFVYVVNNKVTAVDRKGDLRASGKFLEANVDEATSERFFKTFCLTNDGCIAVTTSNLMLKIY